MQTVTFKATDVFGNDIPIMDSFNNVQIVSKGLRRVYKAIDKVDEEKKDDATLLDYSDAIVPVVVDETCIILGKTSKEDKEQMKRLSYSYIQEFYGKLCKQFTGIELPTVERMQENLKRAQAVANGQKLNDDEELTDPK